MKKYWLAVGFLVISISLPVYAGAKKASRGPASVAQNRISDEDLANRFVTYKSKNSLSTYKTARFFSSRLRMSPQEVLKRYIAVRFNKSKNADPVVVEAVNAFKESGLSYQESLSAVSDIVGQLTETLHTIYTRASGGKVAAR